MVTEGKCGVYITGRYFGEDRHCQLAATVEVDGRCYCKRHANSARLTLARKRLSIFADDYHDQIGYQRQLLIAWLVATYEITAAEREVLLRQLSITQLIFLRNVLNRWSK